MPPVSAEFSSTLASAFRISALPVAAVAAELRLGGHHVSSSQLTSWQRGNSLPLGASWQAAIEDLERSFEMELGRLGEALARDAEGKAHAIMAPHLVSRAGAMPPLDHAAASRHFRELDQELEDAVSKTTTLLLSQPLHPPKAPPFRRCSKGPQTCGRSSAWPNSQATPPGYGRGSSGGASKVESSRGAMAPTGRVQQGMMYGQEEQDA